MGNEKEDSGFGFKDKAKAEETLRLLEKHELNYRRLTVRGLLGRAKRVLTMTKAEDKIKNIKEAMEVFEKWLADLDKNKDKKTEKKEKENSRKKEENGDKEGSDVEMQDESKEKKNTPETVPGLGFKDKSAAEGTLKELEGRDPEYQKLAVKGLIRNAKRVLTCTRDEIKKTNIKEAIAIFDKFLDDFETQHLSRQNNSYLSLGIVKACLQLDKDGQATAQQKSFIAAYESVNGEYKRLRTVAEKEGEKTWDIVRNAVLKDLKEKYAESELFKDNDQPTKEHMEMLLWAYSPEPARIKKSIPEAKEEEESNRKRKSSVEEESPSKKKRE